MLRPAERNQSERGVSPTKERRRQSNKERKKRKTGEDEAQTVLETTGNCALRAESRHRRGTKGGERGEAGGGGSRAHIEAHKNFSRKRRQEDRNRDKGNEKKQYIPEEQERGSK